MLSGDSRGKVHKAVRVLWSTASGRGGWDGGVACDTPPLGTVRKAVYRWSRMTPKLGQNRGALGALVSRAGRCEHKLCSAESRK